MLQQLRIKNGYRHPNSVFNFQEGQTAITGKNESGKSVTLEMILFALWGSQALRGVADDYKKLEVILDFMVKGVQYRVTRTTKNAKLQRLNGDAVEDVATGTKPVNAKMKEIFGYDFDVFTMANACLQGQIEKLSDAKPTERKKIVDQTIGLHLLDDLIKHAGEQALTFRRQAEGIASVLREPVKPEVPSNFESSTTVAQKREVAVQLATELNQLRGMVAHKPSAPVAPTCAVTETVETLQGLLDARAVILDKRQVAEAAVRATKRDKTVLEGDLIKIHGQMGGESSLQKELARVRNQLASLVMPAMTLDDIERIERQHIDHSMWVAKQKLLGQGEHVCPSCDHHWPLASAALEGYANVVETAAPTTTRAELNAQRTLLGNVERKQGLEADVLDLEASVATEKKQLENGLVAKAAEVDAKAAEVAAVEAAVAEFDAVLQLNPDRSEDLRTRQKYDGELLTHGAQVQSYKLFFEQLVVRETRIAELEPVEQNLKDLEERLVVSRAYEQAYNAYEGQVKSYAADKGKLDDLVAQSEDWGKAKEAVAEAKTVIKSFLVPSLNKVASLLLNQMTGGARSSVVVDEDFESILVDGQQVQTLSGSGKAVANLALRIGLGQVLTNGVFSVFMADEFDESMDEERARYTAECLQRLKETIKQVIVVTHKRPIADHIFTLPFKEAA